MTWIDKIEKKLGRFAIRELMKYIVAITGVVYILDRLFPYVFVSDKLALVPSLVLRGEVWRIITYVFIPPSTNIIFILFVLYFYFMIGTSLEHEWGSFKFNMYYFLGMIGTTIAVLITGGEGTSVYLNLSLFLAFAHIYPDYEILLFYILPVKVKYLGWLNWAYIAMAIVTEPLSYKIAAIVSIINFFIFFGKEIVYEIKNRGKSQRGKKKFQSQVNRSGLSHKCTVCGITPKDDPNMDFRYCPDCDGLRCYCTKHIKNHQHLKFNDTKSKVIEFPTKKE